LAGTRNPTPPHPLVLYNTARPSGDEKHETTKVT